MHACGWLQPALHRIDPWHEAIPWSLVATTKESVVIIRNDHLMQLEMHVFEVNLPIIALSSSFGET
jgi:hypothetical protein